MILQAWLASAAHGSGGDASSSETRKRRQERSQRRSTRPTRGTEGPRSDLADKFYQVCTSGDEAALKRCEHRKLGLAMTMSSNNLYHQFFHAAYAYLKHTRKERQPLSCAGCASAAPR